MMSTSCTCEGGPPGKGGRHATGCPAIGSRKGTSRAEAKERGVRYGEGNPAVRLPPELGEEASIWADAGRAGEAAAWLKKKREGWSN
jgi:hypothetical protein